MVFSPSLGDAPRRIGPGVAQLPDFRPRPIPADRYTDAVRFERERERVLRRSWIVGAHSSEVAAPGDWVVFEGHGETVVITRQPGGRVAAFHNVCQHRGPAIVGHDRGCGARRFKCPYHGWVYDTTGKVVGVPEREDFFVEDLAGLAAPPVAAEEWGGFVWLFLAGPDEAPPLVEWIGPEIVADLGRYRLDDMILYEKLQYDVPVNYKAIVDGFNEVYHATELHHVPPEFTRAARHSAFHLVGRNSMQFVPRASKMDLLWETGDHHRYAITDYQIFPNSTFNGNPEAVQLFNPIPIDVDRTKFVCWQLIYPPGPDEQDYDAYFEMVMGRWQELQGVIAEDIAIYDRLAKTKHSGGYRRNVLSEREVKIGWYHHVMDEMVDGNAHA